jgi:hypothetical protein
MASNSGKGGEKWVKDAAKMLGLPELLAKTAEELMKEVTSEERDEDDDRSRKDS